MTEFQWVSGDNPKQEVLNLFVTGLTDVSEVPESRTEEDLLLYHASILAHYAQTSTESTTGFPTPKTLTTVFDHFVLDQTLQQDSKMMEEAGGQCLLLSGFFEDQMRHRHNIRWYSELGSGFFRKASETNLNQRRAKFLKRVSSTFEVWRRRHAKLSRGLRAQRYILRQS
jgi:hypothetical protein